MVPEISRIGTTRPCFGSVATVTVTASNTSTDLAEFRTRVREWLAANATKRKSRVEAGEAGADVDEEAGLLTQEAPTADRGADEVAVAKAFQAKLFDAGL